MLMGFEVFTYGSGDGSLTGSGETSAGLALQLMVLISIRSHLNLIRDMVFAPSKRDLGKLTIMTRTSPSTMGRRGGSGETCMRGSAS